MMMRGGWATKRPSCPFMRGAVLVRRPLGLPQQQQQWLRQRRRGGQGSRLRLGAAVDERFLSGAAWGADGLEGEEGMDPAELEIAMESYIGFCQEHYGMEGAIEFGAGLNGLPMVTLRHPSGAECDVYMHGATVTGWRHVDGRELLYVSPENDFDGEDPISGGIPIAWPQCGVGPLPVNGFLRHLHWSVVETTLVEGADDPAPTVSFYADTDPDWERVWPHKFEAVYSVTLMQPEPPKRTDAELLEAMEGPLEFDASEVGGMNEDWTRSGAGAAAAAGTGDEQPRRRGRPGGAASASASVSGSLDSDDEGPAGEVPGERARGAGGAATTGSGAPSSRYVYGGALPSSEKLQQDAAEEERRSWAEVDTLDEEKPSQLRCMLQVHNAGEAPFSFTTALQTHLAAEDISFHPKVVKTVGLRGKYVLDYSTNPMRPSLGVEDEDLVLYGRKQIDRVYVDVTKDGDVMHCPGSQSHFEVVNLEGFSDVVLQNPALTNPQEARYYVGLHSARAARPITLQPGQSWCGTMVLRAHRKYWDLLPWEESDTSMVPAPPKSASLEDVVSCGDDGSPSYEPLETLGSE